jgi:lipopolysaccharide/colanic/teichoic acid biosynthesis glycosyltransferase
MFAPLFLLIALAIRLDSPGPALFRQTRIGKDGQSFNFYKFRSMYHGVDRSSHQAFFKAFVNGHIHPESDDGTVLKPAEANQITPLGRFLRRTSLDELPQIINIVKGEMSFIGPRPNVPEEVQEYKEWHERRLAVLPGITGWAQVNGRSCITFDRIAQYDLEYVENQSLLMDLLILGCTVPLVLRGKGAE